MIADRGPLFREVTLEPRGTVTIVNPFLFLQNFILQSSSFLLEATHNLVQFTSVLIEVPSTWSGCTVVTSPSPRRIPFAAADVLLREDAPARAFQPELCGVKVGKNYKKGTLCIAPCHDTHFTCIIDASIQ